MECPRCGNDLDRYTLGGREAVSCERCGYTGVPVDHRSEPLFVESWDEAISRYFTGSRIESVTVKTVGENPSLEVVLETSDDTDTRPEPTVVRVDQPDPALAAAFEAAEAAEERFVCDICGRDFETQQKLYGHLSVHSGDGSDDASEG